jgi:hypothetical protein
VPEGSVHRKKPKFLALQSIHLLFKRKKIIPSQTARSSRRCPLSLRVSSVSFSTTVPFWSNQERQSSNQIGCKLQLNKHEETARGLFSLHLWVIKKPQRRRVGAQEIPHSFVVYLHGREFQDELPLRMLQRENGT